VVCYNQSLIYTTKGKRKRKRKRKGEGIRTNEPNKSKRFYTLTKVKPLEKYYSSYTFACFIEKV
jgi:hypothetical protein